VIGASDDPSRIGGMPIRFLRRHGYPGMIFPVNPKYKEIAGLPCYARLADIDDLFQAANLLACYSPPGGNRLAILSFS